MPSDHTRANNTQSTCSAAESFRHTNNADVWGSSFGSVYGDVAAANGTSTGAKLKHHSKPISC
jgi:hypothetical protein